MSGNRMKKQNGQDNDVTWIFKQRMAKCSKKVLQLIQVQQKQNVTLGSKGPSHKYRFKWTAPAGRKEMLHYTMAGTLKFLNQNTMKKSKNITKKG